MPSIHVFIANWEERSAEVISDRVVQAISRYGSCNLFLTGGNTVQAVYRHLSSLPIMSSGKVVYFFGDERCVPPDHADSNWFAACLTLFPHGIPDAVEIKRMQGENADPEAEAARYEFEMPERIDVLLLVPGVDGHIASLFPGHSALKCSNKRVVAVDIPSKGRRLTITPAVFQQTENVIVLAKGHEKGIIMAKAIQDPLCILELPVRLAMKATWLLDGEAGQAFCCISDGKLDTFRKTK